MTDISQNIFTIALRAMLFLMQTENATEQHCFAVEYVQVNTEHI